MAERPHNFLREGVITGFIGATAIVIWFLVVDTISGRPFYTPIFLGKGVVSVLGKNMMGDTAFTQVLGYTVFNYAAFFIVGIVLTVIVHQAERTPGILAGLLVAFVIMTLGFYMIAAAFAQSAKSRRSYGFTRGRFGGRSLGWSHAIARSSSGSVRHRSTIGFTSASGTRARSVRNSSPDNGPTSTVQLGGV